MNRLVLKPSVGHWLELAQTAEQIRVEPLTAEICIESVNLPGEFHRDPADRLIVAFTRLLKAELITTDQKILNYPGVQTIAAN